MIYSYSFNTIIHKNVTNINCRYRNNGDQCCKMMVINLSNYYTNDFGRVCNHFNLIWIHFIH